GRQEVQLDERAFDREPAPRQEVLARVSNLHVLVRDRASADEQGGSAQVVHHLGRHEWAAVRSEADLPARPHLRRQPGEGTAEARPLLGLVSGPQWPRQRYRFPTPPPSGGGVVSIRATPSSTGSHWARRSPRSSF